MVLMKSGKSPARLPANYEIVLDIVREQGRGQHATTGDIFAEAKRRKATIGYSTVYRALDRLEQLGLVSEVRIPGTTTALYEPVGTNHVHFVCEGCGMVEDIDHSPSPKTFSHLAEDRHIEITGISLTLHGRCAACKADEASLPAGRP
jgi:Fur family ferric uptake transcriptional regulator